MDNDPRDMDEDDMEVDEEEIARYILGMCGDEYGS